MSKNTTMRNQPTPRAHVPNHAAHVPAENVPGSVIRAYTPYSSASSPRIQSTVPKQKSQPIGFSGRREATRAPTVENARTSSEMTAVFWREEVGSLSEARSSVSAVASTVSTHIDQANHEAVRWLIPPTP